MKSKFWLEIDTRQDSKYAVVYSHSDCRQSTIDSNRYFKHFYLRPLSDQYKLLEDANNGLDPLKCKKDNLDKLKKLLRLNKFKYKEDI